MAQATELNSTNHGSNVIDLAARRAAKAAASTFLAGQSPTQFCCHSRAVRNIHSETLFALPFVTKAPADVTDWAEFWHQTKLWNDEPTRDQGADYHRGGQYAEQAIKAIIDDDAIYHDLTLVMQRMIAGAFKRKGPGGGLCRTISSSEQGFIDALCKIAVEASRCVVAANLPLERA